MIPIELIYQLASFANIPIPTLDDLDDLAKAHLVLPAVRSKIIPMIPRWVSILTQAGYKISQSPWTAKDGRQYTETQRAIREVQYRIWKKVFKSAPVADHIRDARYASTSSRVQQALAAKNATLEDLVRYTVGVELEDESLLATLPKAS